MTYWEHLLAEAIISQMISNNNPDDLPLPPPQKKKKKKTQLQIRSKQKQVKKNTRKKHPFEDLNKTTTTKLVILFLMSIVIYSDGHKIKHKIQHLYISEQSWLATTVKTTAHSTFLTRIIQAICHWFNWVSFCVTFHFRQKHGVLAAYTFKSWLLKV